MVKLYKGGREGSQQARMWFPGGLGDGQSSGYVCLFVQQVGGQLLVSSGQMGEDRLQHAETWPWGVVQVA